MLFRDITSLFYESYVTHVLNAKKSGTNSNHVALKCYKALN